ncbi:sulfate/molybdate ABC transporter ATP-binding protein [Nocardioides campestrisoli]|uniref:sulfate/molybdate ABC transporter ATP-binding protein n=1 Tax=Nocardioides campestrisoli TaxID=2736757 RepID=UPI0015E62CC9|nr:ATP-binding cassette domain-containing protein [Nocardioides campestrisoli]
MSLQLEAVVDERGVEVSLEVSTGETVALLGPNGAGKSTLLAVAAGLLTPDRGRVVLDGRVLTAAGHQDRKHVPPHERHVGLMAQDPLLFPHLSVEENVAFGPRSTGTPRREARVRARDWLREVGVDPALVGRRPAGLSGGQAQRVALARALATDPRLLLLDEPLAAVDVSHATVLRQTLRRVLADRTVVLVTHDVLDALLLADRVVVLEHGRVVEDGPCEEVLSRPRSAFAARIAGLNMVRGTWREGAVHSPAGLRVEGVPDGSTPGEGEPAVAVFHPQAVSVFLQQPGGSPRNVLPVTVTALEPHGAQVRLRAGDLTADVTARALTELDLATGSEAVFVVKAQEVAVYAG